MEINSLETEMFSWQWRCVQCSLLLVNVEYQNVEHRVLETKESFKWYLTLIPTFKLKPFHISSLRKHIWEVNLILLLLFLRCEDHKIIIMPLVPNVILFIDTDITVRDNVDKPGVYRNHFILQSTERFIIVQHCSPDIIDVYKLKYQPTKNSFQTTREDHAIFLLIFYKRRSDYRLQFEMYLKFFDENLMKSV